MVAARGALRVVVAVISASIFPALMSVQALATSLFSYNFVATNVTADPPDAMGRFTSYLDSLQITMQVGVGHLEVVCNIKIAPQCFVVPPVVGITFASFIPSGEYSDGTLVNLSNDPLSNGVVMDLFADGKFGLAGTMSSVFEDTSLDMGGSNRGWGGTIGDGTPEVGSFEGNWILSGVRLPEPGTLVLLGIGLAGLGHYRRRQ